MNSMTPIPSTARSEAAHSAPIATGSATPADVAGTTRVLRNTYALLSMTLLFSAAIAAASVAFQLPAPGILEIKAAPERPDEPSLYRKPSPRFILEKIAEHGLDPARCWMTGDRVTDWEAGLNAGIRSCAMRSGAAKPEELWEAARRGFAVHDDFPAFVRAELKLAF